MADRLKFNFVKLGKLIQRGECWVDVKDPTDHKEIAKALEQQNFVRFCVDDQEWEDGQFAFFPAQDNDPTPTIPMKKVA